jgi:predicted lactoylglutathione lyase
MKKLLRNNLIIELHIPDLEVARSFYSKLGFIETMYDKPNEKEQGYLTMTRNDKAGNTMLNFYGGDDRVYMQSFFKQFPKDTKRGFEVSVTIVTEEIDELYKRASKELSKNIVREIAELKDHDNEWKDFRMVDPFGYYLRFTEPVDWGQE